MTRRSARASAASSKRISYREDSDGEELDDSTDEFQVDDHNAAEDDEALEDESAEPSEEDSDEGSTRSPKRRRKDVSTPNKRGRKDVSTPTKSAPANPSSGEDWAPGVIRVVAKLVGPPTSGHVAKGELSPNVLKFLSELKANNDRDWFARHDAVYRYCLKNFTEFAGVVMNDIMEKVDDTVPWLPSKDFLYRIYRDVRFSNDKTPYKVSFCATFSRGGRKGPFAGYHVLVKPGGGSFFAAGRWDVNKEDLAVIRQHILDDTQEAKDLKAAVREPEFVKWFGPPKGMAVKTKGKGKKGLPSHAAQRCNLWGGDNELKVAPKIPGVDKTHKDIDWLKLRSFCVITNFTDEEVLRKDFRQRLVEVARVSEPLVRIINSMTSPDPPPPPPSDDDDANGAVDDDGDGGSDRDDDEEELVPTESFDYADDDEEEADDANSNDDDEEEEE